MILTLAIGTVLAGGLVYAGRRLERARWESALFECAAGQGSWHAFGEYLRKHEPRCKAFAEEKQRREREETWR
jgi:hypothetical protein